MTDFYWRKLRIVEAVNIIGFRRCIYRIFLGQKSLWGQVQLVIDLVNLGLVVNALSGILSVEDDLVQALTFGDASGAIIPRPGMHVA